MSDKELIAAVRDMPDASSQVRQQLILAEAWHAQKKQEKSEPLYNDAIKSIKPKAMGRSLVLTLI